MKGLLVRVGIDSTDGCWNSPMSLSTNEFAFVTITDGKPMRKGLARRYEEFVPVVNRFGEELPAPFLGNWMHKTQANIKSVA